MAHALAERCNAAWAHMGGSLRARREAPAAVLRELEIGGAIPALARLASGYFSPRWERKI